MKPRLLLETTVGEALEATATGQPDAAYLTIGRDEWTFGELWEQSGRLASGLTEIGLRRGDRVTTFMPNRAEWVIAAFALARLGVVNVLANPRYRTGELAYLVAHSRSRCLISEQPLDDAFDEALVAAAESVDSSADALQDRVTIEGESGGRSLSWAPLADSPVSLDAIADASAGLDAQDVLYIIYTSGTTGQPKGSMTRHGPALKNAFNSGERMGFASDDRLLCYLTMTHCFGAVNALLNTLTHGCRLDLEPEFDPDAVLGCVEGRGITAVYGVPTHFTLLLEASAAAGHRHDLGTLVKGCCGGGEISAELQEGIETKLGMTGLTHAYGMTESTAIISQSDHSWPIEQRLGTAGTPLPDVEVRIVDPDSRAEQPVGEPGEILIRGFNVHAGYFMLDPDPSLRPDGWWATGDVGSRDAQGCITIRGRSKDMYKTSGFNVYPIEVENCLARHPAVGEVAVVGVPDSVKLEAGAAFVIPAPGAEVDPDELRAFARAELVGYKAPDHVFVVDDFPRSGATLKIQKHELRARCEEMLAARA